MRRRVVPVVLALVASGTWSVAVPTPAGSSAPRVSVDPSPVAIPSNLTSAPITVRWTGQAPDTLILIRICRRSSAEEGFRVGIDCSALTEVDVNGTADGSGSARVDAFHGPEPGGDGAWGCFAPGQSSPAGIERHTTCYVRVTNDVITNADDVAEAPFTVRLTAPTPAAAPIAAVGAGGAPAEVDGLVVGRSSPGDGPAPRSSGTTGNAVVMTG